MTGRDDERNQQQPGSDPAEQVADRALTSYVEAMDENPAPGFTDWVMRSVATEPLPRRGFLASLALLFAPPGPTRRLAQAAVAVLILTVAVGTTYGIARVGGLLPDGSPAQTVSPSPSPEPSQTPDGSGTPVPSATPDGSDDDDPSGAPEPSDDDDASESSAPSDTPEPSETPEPSDSSGSD